MKKFTAFISVCLLIGKLYAEVPNFDIYGVDNKIQKKIYASCGKLINAYMENIKQGTFSKPTKEFEKKQNQLKKDIILKVKNIDNFKVVDISLINYPHKKTAFATLDLVTTNEAYRIPKKALTPKKFIKKSKGLESLFNAWNAYFERNMQLLYANKFPQEKYQSCPVSHCLFGFDDKELKETLPLLQKGVARYKNELREIIQYSSDKNDREIAIFILGNDNNYQELQKFMMNFIDDPNDGVRNNAMRVLSFMASKHKFDHIDIERIIKALNYPYTTDRNKASALIFNIVEKDPSSHQLVINQAGDTLMKLIKLKQPNNHEFAYLILKVISKKRYSETDYASWEKWINAQRKIA